MNKILSIAREEFLQAVRSKAFLLGLLLMPVMMGGGILVQVLMKDQVDLRDRTCAVVDPSGALWPVLQAANEARTASGIREEEDGVLVQKRPEFLLERYVPEEGVRADIALSRRVREGEIQGFLIITDAVMDPLGDVGEKPLAYHTAEPTFTELPNWLEGVVNEFVRRSRFERAEMDMALVSRLDRRVRLSSWGLVSERPDGSVKEARKENKGRTFGVPAAGMMLLFMLVMISAPQLMNQVLEEKMQRISEVLVSTVSPFQLMMGKLLGSALVSLTLAGLYLGGVLWATGHWGVADLVPASAYAWFVLLLVLALLIYGSMFSALGAACSELRDAQSMMMPAMILILIPLFAWSAVLESPNGTFATALTFFPTATPTILLIRLLAPPGPPLIELVLAVILCIVTTVVFVWASSRVFRIGVLAQGQPPSFAKLVTWVMTK